MFRELLRALFPWWHVNHETPPPAERRGEIAELFDRVEAVERRATLTGYELEMHKRLQHPPERP
jgi:hypothetical protein